MAGYAQRLAGGHGLCPSGRRQWHGGIPEAIDPGRNGFIVPKALLNHLGQACLDVLSLPPEHRAALGAAARQRIVERFQSDAEAEVLRRVLARAVPEARRSS